MIQIINLISQSNFSTRQGLSGTLSDLIKSPSLRPHVLILTPFLFLTVWAHHPSISLHLHHGSEDFTRAPNQECVIFGYSFVEFN
jgi:hypothetical protein